MRWVQIPAPIDVHVHLREPGFTHKEDLLSGTQAALAGGFTAVLDMPNTRPPTTTRTLLHEKRRRASQKAVCDVGFFVGASNDTNPAAITEAAPDAVGLKIYINDTFGSLRIRDVATLWAYIRAWPGPGPIAVHAEGLMLATVIGLVALTDTHVHVVHVSRKEEIVLIKAAKEKGLPITCEVTPHHLFLTQEDIPRLGPYGYMKPTLATAADQEALWKHLAVIDCFATDHAPHTRTEKESENPPPGVPGLETALPLLLTAVHEGRLTLEDVIERTSIRPRTIYRLPPPEDTYTEIEMGAPWIIGDAPLFTRAGWTPFAGMKVYARVRRVVIRGKVHFENGQILVPPGTGRVIPERD